MTPGLPAKSNRRGGEAPKDRQMVTGPADPKLVEMLDTLRQLKKHVIEVNSEYVGERFPGGGAQDPL